MNITSTMYDALFRFKSGDANAFTDIYNESNRYIYVCVNNVMSGNDNKDDLIQDIMQDTYMEIYKHLYNLQNIEKFYSWAGTIATRKCYELLKKHGKLQFLGEDETFDNISDDDSIIPEEIMQNIEKQRLIRDIIHTQLTDMQKICIIHFYYNELKQSEIAVELGIPENSVKSHLLRAKSKIKESMLDIEKKSGTKLYSIAPFMAILLVNELNTCSVPSTLFANVFGAIQSMIFAPTTSTATTVAAVNTANAINASVATTAATTTAATTTAVTTAGAIGTTSSAISLGLAGKIIIGISTLLIATTTTTAVVSTVNNDKNSPVVLEETSSQNNQHATNEPSTKSDTDTGTNTEADEPEVIEPQIVDINESDFENYENALEWLFFSERGSEHIDPNASNYLSEALIAKEIEYRKNNVAEDVYNTAFFYVYEKISCTIGGQPITVLSPTYEATYEEMKISLYKDPSIKCLNKTLSESQDLNPWEVYFMTADEIILSKNEYLGFHSISILSVDNDNRTLEIYDNTYACRYICKFNDKGLIENIYIEDEDKERYQAFYDFISNRSGRFSIRDFDKDGKEELIITISDHEIRRDHIEIYNYENGVVTKTDELLYTSLDEITSNGCITVPFATSNYVACFEYFQIKNDSFSFIDETSVTYDYEHTDDGTVYYYYYSSSKGDTAEAYIQSEQELRDRVKISNSVKARSPYWPNEDYLNLYAETHGLSK